MPFVNIKITRDGVTPEKKATTMVLIEEVETDNWGIGGETVTARRKQGS
jgi:Uncharacterized protein, 4-oxalocrotonate tautomerase homolog